MLTNEQKRRISVFARCESGTSTVEFVILFPAIILIILSFISLSLYMATLSDVQQVASDLTRLSLRYVDMGGNSESVCSALQTEVLPSLSQEFAFVASERITGIACAIADDGSRVSVSVTYNLDGHYLQRFGSSVGLDISQFARAGVMRM